MKRIIFAFLAFSTAQASLAACIPMPANGKEMKLASVDGTVRLISQDDVDTPVRSSLTQTYAFTDVKPAPSEVQVRTALNQLYANAQQACRRSPVTDVRIFLYVSPASAISSSWVARLNAEKMKPLIDIRENMLLAPASAKLAECDPSKEPGKSYGSDPKLPPLSQRKILGTWVDGMNGLTTSLEDVGGKIYKVYRSKYCSSGATGEPLRKGTQGRYYRKESSSGDYYVILKTGELGVYDRDGQIDALPKHPGLYPRK